MSVINETLDNLKQSKKQKPKSLDPSASSYAGSVASSENKAIVSSSQAMLLPIGLAVLLAISFVVYHHNTSPIVKAAQSDLASSKNKVYASSRQISTERLNILAQGQYYTAMNLLNEGKHEQALSELKKIIDTYPEFAPAKNVYSMLHDY